MKFALTPYEKLGLTIHMFAIRPENTEQGRTRLKAWGQLGVDELADALSMGGTVGADGVDPKDWRDRETTTEVELSDSIVAWLLKGLSQPRNQAWADMLCRLETRLIEAKDAKG